MEFRLLDVFCDDRPFTGNPLAVFPAAGRLSDAEMQALGRQLNLSETTFVTALDTSGRVPRARVRIFTPALEMGFAGHPTLGTAAVLGELTGADEMVLVENVGDIRVTRAGPGWQLTARPGTVTPAAPGAEVAAALGLSPDAVVAASIVDAGSQGLLVRLRDKAALAALAPTPAGLAAVAQTPDGEPRLYAFVWTHDEAHEIRARMLYGQDGGVLEDPATGSQCANLGAWLAAREARGRSWTVGQGAATGRPSVLRLHVDDAGAVHVGGAVRVVASGTWAAPAPLPPSPSAR